MTLILLAHQDDEIPIFNELLKIGRSSEKVMVIYLTSGTKSKIFDIRRNKESLRVLSKFNILEEQVVFLGSESLVFDGRLIFNLERIYLNIIKICEKYFVKKIICHAWEGGHEDHDAAYLIALAVSIKLNILKSTYQFPFYNGQNISVGYKLFNPLLANGSVLLTPIAFKDRIGFSLNCLFYRSQWRTMALLLPYLIFHNFLIKNSVLQLIKPMKAIVKPHDGLLLYERRKKLNFEDFYKEALEFVKNRIL